MITRPIRTHDAHGEMFVLAAISIADALVVLLTLRRWHIDWRADYLFRDTN